MKTFKISWVIDVKAANPRDAALAALAIQRNQNSTACVFTVTEPFGGPVIKEHHIDLMSNEVCDLASSPHQLPKGG